MVELIVKLKLAWLLVDIVLLCGAGLIIWIAVLAWLKVMERK